MVRALVTIALCLFIGAGGTGTAHAETTTQQIYTYSSPIMTILEEESTELYALTTEAYQGQISTTYITFFRDIVSSLSVLDDYVFFRSGDSTYTLYSGDLEYSNGYFYMNGDGKEYVITQMSGSGYGNSYYSYRVSNVSDVGVNVGSYLVYSNLGDFPQLEDRGVQYEFALFMAVFVIGLCALVRPLSSFVLRLRNGN